MLAFAWSTHRDWKYIVKRGKQEKKGNKKKNKLYGRLFWRVRRTVLLRLALQLCIIEYLPWAILIIEHLKIRKKNWGRFSLLWFHVGIRAEWWVVENMRHGIPFSLHIWCCETCDQAWSHGWHFAEYWDCYSGLVFFSFFFFKRNVRHYTDSQWNNTVLWNIQLGNRFLIRDYIKWPSVTLLFINKTNIIKKKFVHIQKKKKPKEWRKGEYLLYSL